jgi:transcriptional accessory protein Tex/SPT6
LLHVREMSDGYVAKPEDVVQVGEKLEARIIEVSRRRQRIDLSLKGLRPEPEPEPEPLPVPTSAPAARSEPEPGEDEASHPLDEVEVLSPMELAFKRAMEAEGIQLGVGNKKQGRRRKHAKARALQDEIIARTLEISRSK